MPGLFVYITPLETGAALGRSAQLRGTIGGLGSGGLREIEIQFGVNGPIVPVQVVSPKTTNWSWQGLVPNSVRPGDAVKITVRAKGYIQVKAYPEPEYKDVDGEGVLDATLENIVPLLTLQPIQTTVVTETLPLQLRLSGRLTEGNGPPYAPRLQFRLGQGLLQPVAVSGGAWQLDLSLAPGSHVLKLVARDDFNSESVITTTLKVLRYVRPAAPATNWRTTLAGAPTTASLTGWARLEPRCRDADMSVTSSARLLDPLWLFTRQWQLGEFQAEDAGTPVQARVRATSALVSRTHLGPLTSSSQGMPYDPARMPLEVLAERRRMRARDEGEARMLPLAVEAGQLFLRRLEPLPVGQKYRARLLARYAFVSPGPQTDPAARRLLQSVAGRALDARRLAQALRPPPGQAFAFDPALQVAANDAAALRAVCDVWLAWYDGLCAEPAASSPGAWNPERLEHGLSVAARMSAHTKDALTLTATEFDGGRLDWYHFDTETRVGIDTQGDRAFTRLVETSMPAPITFHGAPAPRFWEMEDARVAYGLVSSGPTDQLQLMAMEYAGTYGNDWFVVPLTLKVGSVTRVESLVVTDSFGVRSLLRPIGDPALPAPHFSMWQLSAADAPVLRNCFFLAPGLGQALEGAVVEEVLLLRDEMANLAWGIESVLEGPLERGLRQQSPPLPQPRLAQDGAARYRLASPAPEHWIPLLPVQQGAADGLTTRLRRGALLAPDGSSLVRAARSEALNAGQSLSLFEEEVPREGARLTRRRRLTRWIDGSTWLWTAFRRDVGRGEGSSGLAFDSLEDPRE